MTTVLLTDLARDALTQWLQAQLPAQIAAVNAARPDKHPLSDISTWTGNPLVATPEPPALMVLPQLSGFRGTQLAINLDEDHHFIIYLQVGNQDEETAQTDLNGYAAAVLNAMILHWRSKAPLPNSAQLLPREGGSVGGLDVFLRFGDVGSARGLYYTDASIEVLVRLSEVL